MKYLVLGSDGMLGHMVVAYFREKGNEVAVTSRREGDANYYDAYANVYGVREIIVRERPVAVINCIGILNQVAEDNHGLAVLLNGFLPNYLDGLAGELGFKLVHVTTDCVFDGSRGDYTETDVPDAKSFYGLSKALGEVNSERTLTLRTSIVGPDRNIKGVGLFQWFTKQSGVVKGYTKAIWTGVTTLQLCKVMEEGLEKGMSGLHHAVNGEKISKYDLLRLFGKYFNGGVTVEKDDSYVSDKSLVLSEGSYRFAVPGYAEMVKEMSEWVMEHPEMYPDLIGKHIALRVLIPMTA